MRQLWLDRRLQLLRVALRTSRRFTLQAILIAFAGMAGTAAVIVSSSYGEAGTRTIVARYDALGARMVAIAPIASRAVGGRARTGAAVTTLTLADQKALISADPSISASSATVSASYRIRAGDLTKQVVVIGCEPDYFTIKHWGVSAGATFSSDAVRANRRLVLLGSSVARDLFGGGDPTGERLTINRVPFTIAGVLEERGSRLDGSDEDDQIYVPLGAAMHRLMNLDYLGGILLQADRPADVLAVAERASDLVAKRHRRFGGVQPDFTVTNQQLILEGQLAAFGRLSFFVRWASFSALAVCAFGAAGICWLSVNARRSDIGAMQALGALPGDILFSFLVEAMTPAILGILSGLGMGYLAARILQSRIGETSAFNWSRATFDAALCLSVFAALIALTSRRAARVPPATALKGAGG